MFDLSRRGALVWVLAVGLGVVGGGVAFAQDVRSNYMPGTDFSKYKTYRWVEIQGANHPDQIQDQMIKQAIDSALTRKGLSKVDADPADLYVAYQVAVDQEKQWNAYGGGLGGVRFGGMGTATSSTISIGTLAVDMYDPASKQLVWKGTATKTIKPSKSQEKAQENLQKGIDKLFKDYPPTK